MYLTLILGPMFSGKTSYLITKFKTEQNQKILSIKYSSDNRYNSDKICSHDHLSIPAIKINDINLINNLTNYDIVLIDEGQFFKNLDKWIRNINFKGKIYISALNGDYNQKPFGDIPFLISKADEIIFLHGKCQFCHCCSSFSKRIVPSLKQVEIGGTDKYVPVCGECLHLDVDSSLNESQ